MLWKTLWKVWKTHHFAPQSTTSIIIISNFYINYKYFYKKYRKSRKIFFISCVLHYKKSLFLRLFPTWLSQMRWKTLFLFACEGWKKGGKRNFMFFRGVENAWENSKIHRFSTVLWGKQKKTRRNADKHFRRAFYDFLYLFFQYLRNACGQICACVLACTQLFAHESGA